MDRKTNPLELLDLDCCNGSFPKNNHRELGPLESDDGSVQILLVAQQWLEQRKKMDVVDGNIQQREFLDCCVRESSGTAQVVVAQYRKDQEQNEKKMEVAKSQPREFLECCVRQCTEDLGGDDNEKKMAQCRHEQHEKKKKKAVGVLACCNCVELVDLPSYRQEEYTREERWLVDAFI